MMTVGIFWRAKWISPLCFDLCQHRVSRSFKRQRAHLQANGLHSVCVTAVRGQDAAKSKLWTDWELNCRVARTFGWGCSPFVPTAPHMQLPLQEPKPGPDSVLCFFLKPEKSALLPLPSVGIPRRGRETGSVLHLSPNMHPSHRQTSGKALPQQGRVTPL